MPRVPYDELYDELLRILLDKGFQEKRATLCARLFVETSRDGVYSHGLNRFPRFISMIESGIIDVDAEPVRVERLGTIERWDGQLGPGNLNAYSSMQRAIGLSREHGMGCITLRNTNHWMRGGTYGWQAAEAGVIGICWTNTSPNMPPWGAREARIGNNPLVIAVPRPNGHVVLDMAMSQFSYGSLESYRRQGKQLPQPGGFDEDNELTRDPATIENTGRPLPVGFWKGSGLAIMLDTVAALLSGGKSTGQLPEDPLKESELSQVFIAFDVSRLFEEQQAEQTVKQIIDHLHGAAPIPDGGRVYYPGERTLQRRKENMEKGIPVDPEIWRSLWDM